MRSHANLHLGFLDSERDDGVNLKDKLCFTDYGANTQRRHKFKFPARFLTNYNFLSCVTVSFLRNKMTLNSKGRRSSKCDNSITRLLTVSSPLSHTNKTEARYHMEQT